MKRIKPPDFKNHFTYTVNLGPKFDTPSWSSPVSRDKVSAYLHFWPKTKMWNCPLLGRVWWRPDFPAWFFLQNLLQIFLELQNAVESSNEICQKASLNALIWKRKFKIRHTKINEKNIPTWFTSHEANPIHLAIFLRYFDVTMVVAIDLE